MTTYETLNSETTIKSGIEIVVTTIFKKIHLSNPFTTIFYEMTIDGNSVGSYEMKKNEVNWYIENYETYIN